MKRAVPLVVLLLCGIIASCSQDKPENPPPKAVCGFIPGWAVARLLGTNRIESNLGHQIDLSSNEPHMSCDLKPVGSYDKMVKIKILSTESHDYEIHAKRFGNKVNFRPNVELKTLHTRLGDAKIGPWTGGLLFTCHDDKYFMQVKASKGPHRYKPVRAIVAALSKKFDQEQHCGEDAAPSQPVSSS